MAKVNIMPVLEENLYRIEIFKDAKAGDITVHIPVLSDSTMDIARLPKFFGSTVVGGRFQITFELPGPTLAKAIAGWSEECAKAIDKLESELVKQALLTPPAEPPAGQPIVTP